MPGTSVSGVPGRDRLQAPAPLCDQTRDRYGPLGVSLLRHPHSGRSTLAQCVLVAGRATRYGGTIKALEHVGEFEGALRTFLEVKLAHTCWASGQWGRMTQVISSSFSNADAIQHALAATACHGLPAEDVLHSVVQRQEDCYQRVPSGLSTNRGRAGEPVLSEHGEKVFTVPGNFEAIPTILVDGTALRLIARGSRYLAVSNIDNLGVRVEPALIGLLEASGATLLSEGVVREPGDCGPWLGMRNGRGHLVSREDETAGPFDSEVRDYASIGSFLVHLDRLLEAAGLSCHDLETLSRDELSARVQLAFAAVPRRAVIREIPDRTRPGLTRPILQHERSLNDLPLVVDTFFILVGRDRYFPIKSRGDVAIQLPRLRRLAQGSWLLPRR